MQGNTIRTRVHAILDEYKTLTTQIFTELTGGQTSIATESMNKLIEKDRELSATVKELKDHQEFQNEIIRTAEDVVEKDRRITEAMELLRTAESILSELVVEGKRQLQIRDETKASAPDVTDLVSYSHRISSTTTAPPGWAEGQNMFLYKLPAPIDNEIRAGLLYSKEAEDLFM